jgi:hypothetical protein
VKLPRWIVLVVLGALVAGGVAIDRVTERDQDAPVAVTDDPVANEVTSGTALSSAWYCAAGSAGDGHHEQTVFVTNLGATETLAAVSAYSASGEQAVQEIPVQPGATAVVTAADLLTAGAAAVLVETPGDEVLVEHRIVAESGTAVGPCSSTTSAEWYLPWGTTRKSAVETIYIFNPHADAAVVDVTFETDDVDRDPSAYEGLVVNGRSVVALDIGPEVNRRDLVAASIKARPGSGRVVVERVQELDGSEGIGGLGLTLGAPAAAPEWWFADGGAVAPEEEVTEGEEPPPTTVAEGEIDGVAPQPDAPVDPTRVETFAILNPSESDAEILVDVQSIGVEAFERTVRGDSVIVVETTSSSRVPLGARYGVSVISDNGVPIVVERVRYDADGTALEITEGRSRLATRMVGGTAPIADELSRSVILHNPSSESLVEVSLTTSDGEVVEREIDPNAWELFEVPVGLVQVTSSLPIVGELEVRGEGWVSSSTLVPVVVD